MQFHFTALLLVFVALRLVAQDGNGIYSGSGIIPSNTISTMTNQFVLGKPLSISTEEGTYILLNSTSMRVNLVTQGLVRLGDMNQVSDYPAWLTVNSQAGTINSYAKTDMLFEVDSFFYSLHRGGFQLPENVTSPPAYLEGDRGMIYFNAASKRLLYWDGEAHRPLTTDNQASRQYTVLTTSGGIGLTESSLIYANPSNSEMVLTLPHSADFDGREVMIKNINQTESLQVIATPTDLLDNVATAFILAPNQSILIHAMSLGWQILSKQ